MEQQGTQQNVWSGQFQRKNVYCSLLEVPYTRYIVVSPTLPKYMQLFYAQVPVRCLVPGTLHSASLTGIICSFLPLTTRS